MNKEIKICLYCQTEHECQLDDSQNKREQASTQQCRQCGMALPYKHPNDRKQGLKLFVKVFWLIALFCFLMVFYLPR